MTARPEGATAEARIRALIDDWANALRAKEAQGVMAHYAADSVTFDLAPPLVSTTADAEGLRAWFSTWRDPLGYEIRDLNITAGDDTAFCHCLSRLSGTKTDGEKAEIWFRQTLCFRKIVGEWRIAHQHESVPFYMDGSFRKEKELTRLRDQVSAERRELPWVRVEKSYVFEGPEGKETLADLFDGRSQLMVYHFMFGPDWEQGCPSCSFVCDHIDGANWHLPQRDVTLLAVSRAPLAQIEAFKERMGWRFKWVSSYENDFNQDYHVSFTADEMAQGEVYYNYRMGEFPSEEAPGISVFYKDPGGAVFHTYSAYARGLDLLVGAYNYLDLVPKGRDEAALPWTMAWVRHHDRYGD